MEDYKFKCITKIKGCHLKHFFSLKAPIPSYPPLIVLVKSKASDILSKADIKLLHVFLFSVPGNGNSTLCAELVEDYPKSQIIGEDFSPSVIQHMSEKYQEISNLSWFVGDIRDIQLHKASNNYINIGDSEVEYLLCHQQTKINLKSLGIFQTCVG